MIRQWVNVEDEGAPHALLRRVRARIDVNDVDGLWLFPARRGAGLESTVMVVSSFDPEAGPDSDRRRVTAFRFLVTRDRKARATVEEQFYDFALAPADTLPRVLDGVLRRLGDSAAETPRAVSIERSPERWNALIRELGGPDADTTASDAYAAGPDADAGPATAATRAEPAAAAGLGA